MNTLGHERLILKPDWSRATQRSLDQKDGIPAAIRRMQALADWNTLRGAPSGRAEDELRHALQIAASEYDHPLVGACLSRALEIISAGEKDDRWSTWWSAARNVEHGRFVSVGELARAWTQDRELDGPLLSQANSEILKGAIEERPSWSELAQCEYVDAVQMLILSGDLEAARCRLKIGKRFTRVQRYYDWNLRLLDLLPSATPTDVSAHLDPFFDEVRHPEFPPRERHEGTIVFGVPFLRLRLALIRWIYIERQPVAGNWRHIIGQIGY